MIRSRRNFPPGRTRLITSYETFEHLTDPLPVLDVMVDLLAPGGVVLFSTLLQPAEIATVGMTWWYIGPRNGHISLYSARALAVAWQRHGFTVSSFNPNLHLAFRDTA